MKPNLCLSIGGKFEVLDDSLENHGILKGTTTTVDELENEGLQVFIVQDVGYIAGFFKKYTERRCILWNDYLSAGRIERFVEIERVRLL